MIEFHHRALDELRQAHIWYRARSPRAADRFLEQVDRAVNRLAVDPAAQAKLGPAYHYVRISRFPFVLIYRTRSEGDVFVVAVAHTSRRGGYWRRRS